MKGRVTLAIGDKYHAVLKLLAAARAATLIDLTEELLCDGLRREFERDPGLPAVIRELMLRDERANPAIRDRTLKLLNVLTQAKA